MSQLIFHTTKKISNFSDDPMPSFEDSTCPSDIPEGALCIKVNFPDDCEDLMILVRTSETSFIFEYLAGQAPILLLWAGRIPVTRLVPLQPITVALPAIPTPVYKQQDN